MDLQMYSNALVEHFLLSKLLQFTGEADIKSRKISS